MNRLSSWHQVDGELNFPNQRQSREFKENIRIVAYYRNVFQLHTNFGFGLDIRQISLGTHSDFLNCLNDREKWQKDRTLDHWNLNSPIQSMLALYFDSQSMPRMTSKPSMPNTTSFASKTLSSISLQSLWDSCPHTSNK